LVNFVFLSPHFPPNYHRFAVHLQSLGVNVLGLADEPYDLLMPALRDSLREYYLVNNMHAYDELLRACGYFIHKYGKLDRLDSHNEYWLETEARLRTDFNIDGIKTDAIARIKRKSLMKEVFREAGVEVAAGRVAQTVEEAQDLIDEIGFPLIAKPDIGVGAAKTYKIHNPGELESFFAQKPDVDYILEEFVDGDISSFDGLTDREGKLVFYTAHQYSQGIMETVNEDANVYYFSLREIPADLDEAGRKVLNAFGVRERFFHFEFFRRRTDGCIVALEVNMRPPGGLTTDMFNYANDIDIYYQWAHVMVHNRFTADYTRPYHCAYIGRKLNRSYAWSLAEVLERLGDSVVHHEPISGVFSTALGDYGFLVRSPDLEFIHVAARTIQELA
jgi:biotin carboxylase